MATDMQQVRERLALLDKVGPFFGIAALLLIAFGAYLIQIAPSDRDEIGWGEGWILTALISLVVVEAVGGGVIGRGVKAMIRTLEGVPDGPVTAETRAVLADRPGVARRGQLPVVCNAQAVAPVRIRRATRRARSRSAEKTPAARP